MVRQNYSLRRSVNFTMNPQGGGFVFGALDSDELKCRGFCINHGITVFNMNYRHAPEFPWPTGINDSFDSTKWVYTSSACSVLFIAYGTCTLVGDQARRRVQG